MRVILERLSKGTYCTVGRVVLQDERGEALGTWVSLELPWRDNKRSQSCIPEGRYPLVWEWSHKFGRNLWELKDVPGRSEIKIHPSNHWSELEGCIALGKWYNSTDSWLSKSREAVREFESALEGATNVQIEIMDAT